MMRSIRSFGLVWLIGSVLPSSAQAQAAEPDPQLSQQVHVVLERHCYRCHGQNGAKEGGFDYVLDFKQLVGKKVIPGDPAKSRIFKRMALAQDMPPEEIPTRPTEAEIALIKQWIETGAKFPAAVQPLAVRPFLSDKHVLASIHTHLNAAPAQTQPFLRYFTLTHLHNLPVEQVRDADLRIYRAALSKLINSLSWKKELVLPQPVDPQGTIFAIDTRQLDWDRSQLWDRMLAVYPYGLTHAAMPNDPELNNLARNVTLLSRNDIPYVRADWFISNASRPPLYHLMMQLPEKASILEMKLEVDLTANFMRGQVARAGFTASGVSAQNRLIERHEAVHGYYWRSYDFKSSSGKGNLFVFPMGPSFKDHPFPQLTFKHAGGEMIFSLPNGLQGYMLVDENDHRIDTGPIDVVSDLRKTSGTPQIVNGLSCMACHQQGLIRFKDTLRDNTPLSGAPLEKLNELHLPAAQMDMLVTKDEKRFQQALNETMAPFLKVGAEPIREAIDYPEPISAIARWYIHQELSLDEAASELGIAAKDLQTAILSNPTLQTMGLLPLARGGTIKREAWECLDLNVSPISPFQETARILRRGTPSRPIQ
jgi:serine/threonine-protein kinase